MKGKLLLMSFVSLAASSLGQVDWPRLKFTPVASGAEHPTHIANAGDGSGRLFVVEQAGRILIVENNGFRATPFLDISDRVLVEEEQGLFSVAFPQDFAAKGWCYV